MPPHAPTLHAKYMARCLELVKRETPYLWWAKGLERGAWLIDPASGQPRRDRNGQKISTKERLPELAPGRPGYAEDCSGFVTSPLAEVGGPDHRFTMHTDAFWLKQKPVQSPLPLDLALYGGRKLPSGEWDPLDVGHVMLVLLVLPTGEVMVMGASGGDSTTTTFAIAKAQGAHAKIHTSHLYRSDFRGFRAGLLTP